MCVCVCVCGSAASRYSLPSLGVCLVPNLFPVAAALIKKSGSANSPEPEHRKEETASEKCGIEWDFFFLSQQTPSLGSGAGGGIVIHAGIESRELLLPSERARYCPEFA